MQEFKGKYNSAKVFTDNIDYSCIEQLKAICGQEAFKDTNICVMPDCHAGKGCVVGFTSTFNGKVVPNIVGVDIGCGMMTLELGQQQFDLAKLDEIIHKYIPSGFNINDKNSLSAIALLNKIKCPLKNKNRAEKSIPSLGGGNHFLELDQDEDGNSYFVIHTGSRNLGVQVATYYQKLAEELCKQQIDTKTIVAELKRQGRAKEIESVLKEVQGRFKNINKEFAYLEGINAEDYLHDMQICQSYAELNRRTIAKTIIDKMGILPEDSWSTIHNYIGKDKIIRKGAVSAVEGKKLLIPINMKDGSLICVGKGNSDWNFSAPHGAGRIMSRAQAKEQLTVADFRCDMKDVYSTTICKATLDESPRAYKPMEEIINNIQSTAEVIKIIRPIYNFKACD